MKVNKNSKDVDHIARTAGNRASLRECLRAQHDGQTEALGVLGVGFRGEDHDAQVISGDDERVPVQGDAPDQNIFRRMLHVPPARWRDPIELAQPTATSVPATSELSWTAYSDSKLALMYYAHELQRRAPHGVNVIVFEPGFMPGTGLSRASGPALQRIGRLLEKIPGVSSPVRSGPLLASIVLDQRWAHLRDGAFVLKDEEREVKPIAIDPRREARLWEATAELLDVAR